MANWVGPTIVLLDSDNFIERINYVHGSGGIILRCNNSYIAIPIPSTEEEMKGLHLTYQPHAVHAVLVVMEITKMRNKR